VFQAERAEWVKVRSPTIGTAIRVGKESVSGSGDERIVAAIVDQQCRL